MESLESDYRNITPEPFFNLAVPITEEATLEKSIELYTLTEKLEGDNKIFNEKTNTKEEAEKINILEFTKILVITLKDLEIMEEKTKDL